jgi:hypothetical protein
MATLIALGRSDAPERVRDRLRPFGGERGRRRTSISSSPTCSTVSTGSNSLSMRSKLSSRERVTRPRTWISSSNRARITTVTGDRVIRLHPFGMMPTHPRRATVSP